MAATSTLDLFKRLTSVPTAPFCEGGVTREALIWIRANLRNRVSVRRRRGGVEVRYRGAGKGPALALSAHLDHPAFHLLRTNAHGAVGLLRGRLPPHLLEGSRVEAFGAVPSGNQPLAEGVVGRSKNDEVWPIRWTRPPRRGSKPAFATLTLTPFEVSGGWLSSRSIDDLLGCAISLEVVRRAARMKLKTNITVLLSRAEEVGFIGALDLAREGAIGPCDSVLSVECSRALPGIRPGRGPVVRLGDKACVFDSNLTSLLDAAAAKLKKNGQPVQRLRLTGGSCEATGYLAFGYEASGVAIPLVNYHNGWGANKVSPERVRVSDIEPTVKLLLESARLFPAQMLRGALHARLKKRYTELAPLLG